MHNGSVSSLLQKKGGNINWEMRMKFAVGAATGVYDVLFIYCIN